MSRGTARSEADTELLFVGATATTLAQMFDLHHKDVVRRLAGRVTPSVPGEGSKAPLYHIRDAAPYLCEHKIDYEEFIKRLTPAKLPPMLQDSFWKAQLSRQKFDENRRDLWRTERVIEAMASAFKVARLSIQMFVDDVESLTELTDKQREIIIAQSDRLLDTLRHNLVEEFSQYTPAPDEHGAPLDDEYTTVPADAPLDENENEDDGLGPDEDDDGIH